MFKRVTFFCFGTVLVLFLTICVGLLHVSKRDLEMMKSLLREEEKNSSSALSNTTHQQREGVTKEIWFTQEDLSRLHYRIASQSSLLTIEPQGKKLDLIEKLKNLQCWMQDKLYTSSPTGEEGQQIRFLQAEDGIYRFVTKEFLAQSVLLSLYRLQGHQLPKQLPPFPPFLKGEAKDVSFAVSGKDPQFKAQYFKAEFHTQEEKK